MIRFVLALGAAAVVALPANAPAALAARAEPSIVLDRAEVAVGDQLAVRLAGWPAGNVQVELCGNEAQRGSIDCAVGGAASAAVLPDGSGAVALTVPAPPGACPCVIRVRPVAGGETRTAPVAVKGVPVRTAPPAAPVPTELAASGVRIVGAGSPWAALFAGPAHRTVKVTLRNPGQAPVLSPRLALTSGRPGRTTVIVAAPPVGLLAPGQERTFDLPVTFGAPTWGRYTVRGELLGADQPEVFYAHTHSYPWGLILLPVLALAYATVRWSRRAGRGAVAADRRST
ncbi:hypothetical protein AB0J90_09750 [Micromonospora sp. NPDC049523]|uniref:hypothetical protein n=1 Tax=Micromonospora sp. NPDC049523 TaxID=3155921 RepID=UPI00341C91C4